MDAIGGEWRVDLPDGLVPAAHEHCSTSGTSRYRAAEPVGEPAGWSGLEQHATRDPHVVRPYRPRTSRVLIYDFLMPLTHEAQLRTTLDALFFRDTLVDRLRTLRNDELEEVFPRAPEQGDWDHLEQVLDFIQERFVGYSMTHVNGRCRFGPLLSQDRVSEFERQGARYLMDETTAVTRFVFPYADDRELGRVRYLFGALFVRSMIELAHGEEQIWMIEIGPENRVHIWSPFDRQP